MEELLDSNHVIKGLIGPSSTSATLSSRCQRRYPRKWGNQRRRSVSPRWHIDEIRDPKWWRSTPRRTSCPDEVGDGSRSDPMVSERVEAARALAGRMSRVIGGVGPHEW
jgi:hypothetical protein